MCGRWTAQKKTNVTQNGGRADAVPRCAIRTFRARQPAMSSFIGIVACMTVLACVGAVPGVHFEVGEGFSSMAVCSTYPTLQVCYTYPTLGALSVASFCARVVGMYVLMCGMVRCTTCVGRTGGIGRQRTPPRRSRARRAGTCDARRCTPPRRSSARRTRARGRPRVMCLPCLPFLRK